MDKYIKKLFIVSWTVYFISYFGRLNYAASMLEIGFTEGYSKSQLGAVVTALFISYGVGQLISGLLGDHCPPKPLVTLGLSLSALCNFLVFLSSAYWQLIILWFINGFAMSLIWTPMLKLFTIYMPPDVLRKYCFQIQSSVALGTCFTYLACSVILLKWNWRIIFLGATLLLIVAILLWHKTLNEVMSHCLPIKTNVSEENISRTSIAFIPMVLTSGLVIILVAVLTMGILKDGIMTWIPQFMTDTFKVNSSFSIFLSALLPLVNLIGLWGSKKLHDKTGHDEMKTCTIFYLISTISLGLLVIFSRSNLIICLLLFAIVTSCMLGINTILVSIIPTYFAPYNKVSTIAGLTNATTYLGSALCGYGLGTFSDIYGWNGTLILLVVICFLGLITCIIPAKIWSNFKQQQ